MKIILISGKKRSGKDYFAKTLKGVIEKKGKTCEIYHFADTLKEILAVTLNINIDELEQFKNDNESIYFNNMKQIDFRTLLQRFGTDAMQSTFGKRVWSDITYKNLKNSDYILIPDFRFIHEYKENHITIRMTRSCDVYDNHLSETSLDDFKFDYYVNNDDYTVIEKSAETIFNSIQKEKS